MCDCAFSYFGADMLVCTVNFLLLLVKEFGCLSDGVPDGLFRLLAIHICKKSNPVERNTANRDSAQFG